MDQGQNVSASKRRRVEDMTIDERPMARQRTWTDEPWPKSVEADVLQSASPAFTRDSQIPAAIIIVHHHNPPCKAARAPDECRRRRVPAESVMPPPPFSAVLVVVVELPRRVCRQPHHLHHSSLCPQATISLKFTRRPSLILSQKQLARPSAPSSILVHLGARHPKATKRRSLPSSHGASYYLITCRLDHAAAKFCLSSRASSPVTSRRLRFSSTPRATESLLDPRRAAAASAAVAATTAAILFAPGARLVLLQAPKAALTHPNSLHYLLLPVRVAA